jgi:outer membrane lipoprotein-sorting protein
MQAKPQIMKTIYAFFILIMCAGVALAQPPKDKPQQDKKASKILGDVSKKYRSYKTIKAQFTFKLENTKEGINESQSGTVYLKKDKFKVEMKGVELFCDGKTIWNYLKEDGEVHVSKFDAKDSAENSPTKIFTMYEKGFLYKFIEEKNEGGKIMQHIELTPKDKKKTFFKVKLKIDKAAMQIVSSKIYDKNGNVYTYEIRQFTPDPNLSDAFFVFSKQAHPGVTEVDNR